MRLAPDWTEEKINLITGFPYSDQVEVHTLYQKSREYKLIRRERNKIKKNAAKREAAGSRLEQ